MPISLVVGPRMYHVADLELHASVPAMRAFEQAMFDAPVKIVGAFRSRQGHDHLTVYQQVHRAWASSRRPLRFPC